MKKITVLLICIFIKGSIILGQNTEDKELDASKKAFILSRLCTEVKYNFVHYNDLKFNWDSLCVAKLPSLIATESEDEFIDSLIYLCAQLHDGHTSVYQRNHSKNSDEWIRPFPIITKRVGNRVFVTCVLSSELLEQGVCYGCEILKIDDENVIEYGNKHIRPLLASSTSQWSDYAPFADHRLTKAKGNKVSKILFKSPKGKNITVERNRLFSWDIQKRPSALEFKILKNNVGLLTIRRFSGDNFQTTFDQIYNEILKTNALIIDIRDNEGGNSGLADYVIRHLSDTPIKLGRWSSRKYIAAHASWGYSQEWHIEAPNAMQPIANKTIYKKPVTLLINATTFSSAENLCVTFRGLKRGKIIGTTTAGSTGNPIKINIGFNYSCQICTKNEWDVEGNKFIGIGIIPDIEIKENADMFLKNKDVVIEEALKVLKSH